MSEEATSASVSKPDLSVLRMDRGQERPPRGSIWLWLLAFVVVAIVVTVALRVPLPWLLPKVETTTVRVQSSAEASTVLTATGYTYARSRAAVGAKVIGRVMELRVDEGDRVRQGDVIAVLDSADLEAGVLQAEAAVAEARAVLVDAEREERRQSRLVAAEVVPSAEAEAAETRLEVARAQLGTAQARLASVQAQLEYTVIRAPISGVVIERNVEVGEMVAPGGFTSQQSTGSIVRIAEPASLEVEADINESYIARLELGQPALIEVDAVPGHQFHGKLRQIVPTADRQRAVVEVKVTVDDRDDRLVPDMSCSVTFLQEEAAAELVEERPPRVLVRRSAIVEDGANRFVFRVRDGRVERVAVTLAPDTEGQESAEVEIASGLVGGEEVVNEPSPELEDGEQVRIVE